MKRFLALFFLLLLLPLAAFAEDSPLDEALRAPQPASFTAPVCPVTAGATDSASRLAESADD